MSALSKLIGQTVIAEIYDGNENRIDVKGKVLDVDINDFYFYEKGEPIYVSVSVMPDGGIPKGLIDEDFHQIPLERIRKA